LEKKHWKISLKDAQHLQGSKEICLTKKEFAADKELKADIEATFAAKSASYKQNQKVVRRNLKHLPRPLK